MSVCMYVCMYVCIGDGPNLQGKNMICRFFEPVEATSTVTVEYGFSNEMGRTLPRENIIFCPVPDSVKVRCHTVFKYHNCIHTYIHTYIHT